MKRACVIGWPIAHSRSPLIHGYWLKRYGIDGAYTREPVEPRDLAQFLAGLRNRGFAGCNVTVPHKEAAFALAKIRAPSAEAVGAANTLWFEGEKLACANTDTYGFMANLDASAPGWSEREGPIVVLGAGGSARAIVLGFIERGRRDIRIANRTRARAEDVVRHFGDGVSALAWDARNEHAREAAVIINTTTLGMNGDGDPGIIFDRVDRRSVAADIVYTPLQTEFLKAAQSRGLATVGGLGMLLHQAAPGFEKWFGVRPEVTDELYRLAAADVEGR